MKNFVKNIIKDERGGEAVEVALVTSTVAIGSVASYKSVKAGLSTGLESVKDGITVGTDNPAGIG